MVRADSSGNRASGIGLSDFFKLRFLLLITGILALNLSVVRPIRRQLEAVQQEMFEVRSRMDLLAAQRDQVQSANDLLSLLKAQQGRLEESAAAIRTICRFRSEVEVEAAKTAEVLANQEHVAHLENLLVQQREFALSATRVLEDVAAMQRLLADRGQDVEEADRVLQRMVEIQHHLAGEAEEAQQAHTVLERLSDLKRRILSQARGAEQARKGVDQITGLLAYLVQETHNVEPAQSAIDSLLAIKDRLVIRGFGISAARGYAEQLLDMRDRLLIAPFRSEAADRNLDQLIEMQSKLAGIEGSDGPAVSSGQRSNAARRADSAGDAPDRADSFPHRTGADRTSRRDDIFGPRHYATERQDETGEHAQRILWPTEN